MRIVLALLAVAAAAAAPAQTPAAQPTGQAATVALELSFTGVEAGKGSVMFALFDSAAAYGGKGAPVRSIALPATAAIVATAMTGLAPGRYAVKAFYDVNGNGRMDANPFGMPVEPFAFSNNARGAMGPAAWADAAFEVAANPTRHQIAFN